MRLVLTILIVFLISISGYSQMLSPAVVACAGDYFTNTTASMSITIGEPVTETVYGNGIILTQGFQQGHYYAVGINLIASGDIQAQVYPQPADKDLYIKMDDTHYHSIELDLTDITGKTIINCSFSETVFHLDVSGLASGLYLLNLSTQGSYRQTIKILKE